MTRVEANAKLHEELKKQNQIAIATNINVASISNFNERLMNINRKYFQEKNLEFYSSEKFEKPYVGKFCKSHLLYEELKYNLSKIKSNLEKIVDKSENEKNNEKNTFKKDNKNLILNDQANVDFADTLIKSRNKYFEDYQNYYEKMLNIKKIYSPLELSRIQKEIEENGLDFEEEYNNINKNLYTLQKKINPKPKSNYSNKIIYIIIFSILIFIITLIMLGIILFFI